MTSEELKQLVPKKKAKRSQASPSSPESEPSQPEAQNRRKPRSRKPKPDDSGASPALPVTGETLNPKAEEQTAARETSSKDESMSSSENDSSEELGPEHYVAPPGPLPKRTLSDQFSLHEEPQGLDQEPALEDEVEYPYVDANGTTKFLSKSEYEKLRATAETAEKARLSGSTCSDPNCKEDHAHADFVTPAVICGTAIVVLIVGMIFYSIKSTSKKLKNNTFPPEKAERSIV